MVADFCQFMMIFEGMHQYWASMYVGVDRMGTGMAWVVEHLEQTSGMIQVAELGWL